VDIKDFILIGGGLLIAAVVAHGFWIAWRARRDPLRIDLVTELPEADDEDDLRRLRAELPNGGARVVGSAGSPHQGAFELERQGRRADGDAPMLLDPSEPERVERRPPAGMPPGRSRSVTARDHTPPVSRPASQPRKTEPRLDPAPLPERAPAEERPTTRQRADAGGSRRDKVADVILPEKPVKADEPKEPRRWSARRPAAESRPEQRSAGRGSRGAGMPGGADARKGEQGVDELIVVNVLAPKGKPFVGGGLVEAMRARGLRYGDMNIFHRLDPMTRTNLYSVANVVEPGTFDMADLDHFRSPGVCFFMQLPGPEQPMDAFEDMLKVARDVAVRVGGELKDEQRSVMTGQTVEHYRQRISDFCRRRMSMRA
jgi:cell division protein ZipA